MTTKRCPWAKGPLLEAYHDSEWGVPVRDDRTWLEFLVLEGAQAGLSWETVLRKRDRYREVFENFEPDRVARLGAAALRTILRDPGVIRNRAKIEGTVRNAKALRRVQDELGSFDLYAWSYVGGEPIQPRLKTRADVPTTTPLAQLISKDLRKRGFTFVGPTICYALMQATGMTNDHLTTCHRHRPVRRLGEAMTATPRR